MHPIGLLMRSEWRMKRWQQLIACYSALCVVLAGAVGRSPLLHVSVEHGGAAAPHTHVENDCALENAPVHNHPHPHGTVEQPTFPPRTFAAPPILRRGEKSLTLFGLEPQDIYRAIGRVVMLAVERVPANPAKNGHDHTHHSLPELLLSGAVEGALQITPLVCAPERFTFFSPVAETRLVAAEWNASTATRGPPACC